MGFFGMLQTLVNGVVGQNYRENFFSRYPGPEYVCNECHKTINRNERNSVHIDHIMPQKAGGTNAITNLQALCASCNTRKKDKINAITAQYSGTALIRELKRQFPV